jgi:gliding motility-associated-like protein
MSKKIGVIILCLFLATFSKAQICTGTMGAPAFNDDFGSGIPLYGAPLPAGITGYTYLAAVPLNGTYAISKNANPSSTFGYVNDHDHTGILNGYMMVVNADYPPAEVYRKHVIGLCPNTTYVFSAFLANNNTPGAVSGICGASYIYANVKFQVEYPLSVIQGSVSSGLLPLATTSVNLNWNQFGFVFTTSPIQTSADIVLINNAPGGCGNDYVVDDISLSPCGPSVSLSIAPSFSVFCEGQSATLQSTFTSGGYISPQYQWQFSNDGGLTWNNIIGATSSTFPIASATYSNSGLYQLLVAEMGSITSSNCRIVAGPVTFSVSSLSVNSSSICSSQPTTLTAIGATSYLWSSGATSNSIVVTPTSTTTFTVIGVNGTCTNTAVSSVSVIPTPTISISGITTICAGQSTTLTALGASTYTWNTGSTSNTIILTPSVSTTYSVIATNSMDCTASASSSVSIIPQPTLTANNGTICAGYNFTINPSGATSYSYSSGSAIVSPTINTTYTVNGSNALGCTNMVTLTVNVIPTPTLSVNSGTICEGNSFTITPSGAISYTYSGGTSVVSPTISTSYTVISTNTLGCTISNTAICSVSVIPIPTLSVNSGTICEGTSFTISPTGATTYTYSSGSSIVTPTINTTYTITGTNSIGCIGSASSSVTIIPQPTLTANNGTICAGYNFTINPSGATSYSYSSGSAAVSPTINTTYTVNGSNALGCTNMVTLTVNVIPTPTLSVNSGTICEGNSFTITPSGASSYSYSGGTSVVSPTISSSYTVISTNTLGCIISNTAVCSVSVIPIPTLSVNSGTICEGTSFTITPSGATSYTYSSGSSIVTPTINTTYVINGSSALGCINIITCSVLVIPKPSFTISANTLTLCLGSNSTLNAFGVSSYTWNTGQTINSITVTPTISTIYSVIGSNGIGPLICSSTQTILVTVIPQTTVSAFNNDSICLGNSKVIYALGGNIYRWLPIIGVTNPNASSTIVKPTATTIYTVTASNVGQCASSATVQIFVNPVPFIYAGVDTTINIDETYILNGIGNVNVGFIPTNGIPLICNFCPIVEVNPKESTCYILKGQNSHQCIAYDEICIDVTKDWNIYIPNTFTPNEDGDNDIFIPIGYGISEINLSIFDRWGTLIFKSHDNIIGWDGKFKNVSCEQGVYLFQLEVTTMFGLSINRTGHVTLLSKIK